MELLSSKIEIKCVKMVKEDYEFSLKYGFLLFSAMDNNRNMEAGKNCKLFSQKASSQMFGTVLNKVLSGTDYFLR